MISYVEMLENTTKDKRMAAREVSNRFAILSMVGGDRSHTDSSSLVLRFV